MKLFVEVLGRMSAVFLVGALATLGAGSLLGLETLVSISMAGLLAVASVVEDLGREYLRDGKITRREMNHAFSRFADSVGGHDHDEISFDPDRCPTCGQKIRKKNKQEEIQY